MRVTEGRTAATRLRVASAATVVGAVCAVLGVAVLFAASCKTAPRKVASRKTVLTPDAKRRDICASNLRRIGQATRLYLQDFDDTFPAAYDWETTWHERVNAYADSRFIKDINDPGADNTIWHCPEDYPGQNTSYGVNALVAGSYPGGGGLGLRSALWEDAKRLGDIPDPARVVWAGDTNKTGCRNPGDSCGGPTDWMRLKDAPLRNLSPEQSAAWYADFLAHDYTDPNTPCPNPGAFGCKGPSYRHGRGDTTGGTAMMLLCDGHVRAFRYGTLRVANVFPSLPKGWSGATAAPRRAQSPPPAAATVATVPEYSSVDVGDLGGGSAAQGGGLNERGAAVGGACLADAASLQESGAYHHFAARRGAGGMTRLANPPGYRFAAAAAVSDGGQAVGRAMKTANPISFHKFRLWPCEAVLWPLAGGKPRPLGFAPGYRSSTAAALNDRGQVVGDVWNVGDVTRPDITWPCRAFLWDSGRLELLPLPRGYVSSRATGINNRGLVVGWVRKEGADAPTRAVAWEGGVMRELAGLPGGVATIATGVNDAGQIVGGGDTQVGDPGDRRRESHAVLWESDGGVTDIGTLPGHTSCRATAINSRGTVVGDVRVDPDSGAFVWDRGRGIRLLTPLIALDKDAKGNVLYSQAGGAFAINDSGQILCNGDKGKVHRTLILSPLKR